MAEAQAAAAAVAPAQAAELLEVSMIAGRCRGRRSGIESPGRSAGGRSPQRLRHDDPGRARARDHHQDDDPGPASLSLPT
jgi:hypothetical protein